MQPLSCEPGEFATLLFAAQVRNYEDCAGHQCQTKPQRKEKAACIWILIALNAKVRAFPRSKDILICATDTFSSIAEIALNDYQRSHPVEAGKENDADAHISQC